MRGGMDADRREGKNARMMSVGIRAKHLYTAIVVVALSGCGCPNASQVAAIEHAGGNYIGEFGYHGACRAQWLWFDRPIDDAELAGLGPAIEAMSPETLQLTGQVGITDASIDLINRFTGLKAVYVDGSGISGDAVKRLRQDIRVVHGVGYR